MKLKKILMIILLITIVIPNIYTKEVKAITNNSKVKLIKDHICISLFKLKNVDAMKEVAYVYYRDDDGKNYPAFCVEPFKNGVGSGAGDYYDVTVNQISNNVLWRMLYKGYMGSSYKDWNLETDDDLYYATKTAVHCIEYGVSPKERYETATRVGYGENASLEDVIRRGIKTLDVAQAIYEFGYNGNENYLSPEIKLIKNGELRKEIIEEKEYLIQNYKTITNRSFLSYEILINNFPEGTKILNSNNLESEKLESNNLKSYKLNESNLKIAIPIEEIKDNIEGKISIKNAEIKSYPIFYADSNNSSTQNYVIYNNGYEKTGCEDTLFIDSYKSCLRIIKTDSEDGKLLEGVTFSVEYLDYQIEENEINNEKIKEYITNSEGEIIIENLKPGKIIIKEIKTLDGYILDDVEREIVISYEDVVIVEIKNDKEKEKIKEKINEETPKQEEKLPRTGF